MHKVAVLSALTLLFLLAPPNADAALLAIDLGSDFIKAALVKPGRAPVSIVLNEMSKRKTPAQVAFVDGDRLLGDEAAAVAVRYPERVLIGARDFLGRYANDTGVTALLQRRGLPYTVMADPVRGTVRFQVDKDTSYSVEEVVVCCIGEDAWLHIFSRCVFLPGNTCNVHIITPLSLGEYFALCTSACHRSSGGYQCGGLHHYSSCILGSKPAPSIAGCCRIGWSQCPGIGQHTCRSSIAVWY